MFCKVVPEICGYGWQFVVGQDAPQFAACRLAGAVKTVTWVFHVVDAERRFEAALVKRAVVGYQRQAFNQWFDFTPNFRKWLRVGRVAGRDAVYLGIEVRIIIGHWAYQFVCRCRDFAVPYHHDAYAAHA